MLWKYGPPGLAGLVLRREFIEAAELLRRVSCLDQAWPLSAHELTAAIYYILALKRGERGANPDFEVGEHQTACCQVKRSPSQHSNALFTPLPPPLRARFQSKPISDAALKSFLRVAPFALHFIYDHTPTELQLRAAQRGWHLLFMRATSMPEEPSFAVFAQVCRGRGTRRTLALSSTHASFRRGPALLRASHSRPALLVRLSNSWRAITSPAYGSLRRVFSGRRRLV